MLFRSPVKEGDTVTVRASKDTTFSVFVENILERSNKKYVQGKIVVIDPIYHRELKDWDLDDKNKIQFPESFSKIRS